MTVELAMSVIELRAQVRALEQRTEALEREPSLHAHGMMAMPSSSPDTTQRADVPSGGSISSETYLLVKEDIPGQWTTMATGTLAALNSRLSRGEVWNVSRGDCYGLLTPSMWERLSHSGATLRTLEAQEAGAAGIRADGKRDA